MWEEGFSFFCQGLRANNFLRRLDLRNNQINHQGAEELAMALTQNTSLQELGKSSLPTYIHARKHHMYLQVSCLSFFQLVGVIPNSYQSAMLCQLCAGRSHNSMAFGDWEL